MKYLIVFLLLFLSAAGHATQPKAQRSIAQTVDVALRMEAEMQGRHFGQSCLQQRNSRLRTIFSVANVSRRVIGKQCQSREKILADTVSFSAYIAGTNFLVTGQKSPYNYAVVSDGDKTPDCSLREDDLVIERNRLVKFGRKETFVRPVQLQQAEERKFLALSVLSKYMRRTVAAEGRALSAVSHLLYVNIGGANTVFLVGDEAGKEVLVVPIPSQELVEDADFCGLTFSPDVFLGRDVSDQERHVSRASILEYWRRNAEVIPIDGK